jgi:4-amino-4-deoxy-L-arabinose transferase-like glycosyltransferase
MKNLLLLNNILDNKYLGGFFAIFYFVIYTLLIYLFQPNELYADEYRYYGYGLQLLDGKYALASDTFLWNGPGNPIFVFVFLKLGFQFLQIRYLNALLLSLSFYLFFKTLNRIKYKKYNFLLASILVFYPCLIKFSLPVFYTEIICFFLVTLFIYCYNRYLENKKTLWLLIASLSIGFLILTKLAFFYVVIIAVLSLLIFRLFQKKSVDSSIKVLVLSLLFTLPYFIYTYKQTNKFAYLGNSNGMQLYWMTVEGKNHKGEWHPFPGDWNPFPEKQKELWRFKPNTNLEWYKENETIINQWKSLKPVEANDFLIEKSIKNIKENPIIYIKNISYNCLRMLFDVPRDGNFNLSIFMLPNVFFIFFIIISIFQFINSWKNYNDFHFFLAVITLSYCIETLLLSSYSRFLYVLLPIFFLFAFMKLNQYKWYR